MKITLIILGLITVLTLIWYVYRYSIWKKEKKSKEPEEVNLEDIELLLFIAKAMSDIQSIKDRELIAMILDSMVNNKKSLSGFKTVLSSMSNIEFESKLAKDIQEVVKNYDVDKSHKKSKLKDRMGFYSSLIGNIWKLFLWLALIICSLGDPTLANIRSVIIYAFLIIITSMDTIKFKIKNLFKLVSVITQE